MVIDSDKTRIILNPITGTNDKKLIPTFKY